MYKLLTILFIISTVSSVFCMEQSASQEIDWHSPVHQLLQAAQGVDVAKIEALLNDGLSVNAVIPDGFGQTALHIACAYGRLPIVQFLLDRRAIVNYPMCDGTTPLHEVGHNWLLHKNNPAYKPNECTPAFVCVYANIIRLLYNKGALVNAQNEEGNTTLHVIANSPFVCPRAIECLLSLGADPLIMNRRGQTAVAIGKKTEKNLLCAVERPRTFEEIVKWYRAHELGIHGLSREQQVSRLGAVCQDQPDKISLIKKYLTVCDDLGLVDEGGITVAHYIKNTQNEELITLVNDIFLTEPLPDYSLGALDGLCNTKHPVPPID